MPRPAKPWWWSARGRWAATIDGRRETAPESIGPKDTHAAWEWHAGLLANRSRPPAAPRVADLFAAWVEWDEGRVEAGDRDERAHRLTVSKIRRIVGTEIDGRRFGELAADRATVQHLEALLRAWGGGVRKLSPAYRAELGAVLGRVYRWGSRPAPGRGPLVAANPFAGARLPTAPPVAPRYATRGEAAAWLRWLWRRGLREFALLQRCLIHTGARPMELASASWDDVEWRGVQGSAGWMPVVTRVEWKAARSTGKARRIVIPGRLVRSLRRRAGDRGHPIWVTPRGKAWKTSNLSMYTSFLRGHAIADGVPIRGEGADRLVNYRWRHTAASSLAMAGVELATIAELLGTSVKQLVRTYVHVLPGHVAAAAEVLGAKPRTRSRG